jgi:hypothetical protein
MYSVEQAARIAARHGIRYEEAKKWDWPNSVLATESRIVKWVYQQARGKPGHSFEECDDDASCECHDL